MSQYRKAVKHFVMYSLNDEAYRNKIECLAIFEEVLAQLGSFIKQRYGQEVFDGIMRYFMSEDNLESLKQKVLISQNRKARS